MADPALILTLALLAGPVPAPQAASPDTGDLVVLDPVVLDDVEVMGRRGRALVDAETTLDEAEIDALGADDIGDVIRRVTEDHGLGEAPLVIVNGRRLADPGVFSNFPPDALVRVEVLPPEAGGLYGSTDPSSRVVNIVLQRRFASREGRSSLRRPTAGGRNEASVDLSRSSIVDTRTRRLGLTVDIDTALRAGDRDQPRENAPGGDAVTLKPASRGLAANLSETASIGDWAVSLRGNGRLQERRSTSLSRGEPIESRQQLRTLAMTGGLSGRTAGWSVQASLNARLTLSDRSGLSASEARTRTIAANLGLSRLLFDLPAGPVAANLSGRASRSHSVTERGDAHWVRNGRSEVVSGSLSIPLLRRTDEASIFHPGDLIVTFGGDVNEMDSGRGEGLNAGFAWTLRPKVRVNGTWSTASSSLADEQRFEPEYLGDPVTVFDFQTGGAVEVLPILGGNPDLRAPSTDQLSLSVAAGPFSPLSVQGGVAFRRSEAVDEIGTLPQPTPDVEAAFPDRFRRDADGRLVSIDQRPINFASALSETLSTNLSATLPLGRREARGRRSIVRLGLNQTWSLTNTRTIHAGLPEMDRLAGDGGGQSRRELGLTIDAIYGPWGVNAAVRRSEGYRIRRNSGWDGPDDLRLETMSTTDLKVSYQYRRSEAETGGTSRRGDGLQMQLEIFNLFNARPRASLGDGRPAPGYGRNDQDPIGRTIQISLKRRF